MIKPESNAPSSMKPWVRTTDKQIEELETAVSKITNALNAGNGSIDHEQNQSLSNTFSFTPLDDGSTVTNAQAMNFTGAITSESDISVAGSLIVGDPSRQEYDPLSGEAVGSIPNLEVISGQLEINPITELEYYTTGEFNVTDTSFNVDGYGLIHGDGLQITLANDGQAERQNIEILGASGTGTAETFQIANNASNVAIYTAGRYVNITGVDPAGYNGTNLLVTSVNTGVSPMTFTVAGTETATWVAGGYATINDANSIYEGKLTVQGPAPDYTGVTVSQDGVSIGSNGGDPAISDVVLDSTGLTAPSAFIDQAVINGTRLFISDTAPTAVNDGDIWIDKAGIFTQGGSGGGSTTNPLTVGTSGLTMTTGTSPWDGSAAATIDIDITKVPRLSANNTFTGVNAFNNSTQIGGGFASSTGLEIGYTGGTATTPFIDFHSGATATDYDSRIIASNGNGTNGQGTLTYTAGAHNFSGATTFGSNVSLNSNTTSYGTLTAWANQQLSLAVRNGVNAATDLSQYATNAGTVMGGRTTNALIYAGTTGPLRYLNYTLTAASASSTTVATYTSSQVSTVNPVVVGQKVVVSSVTPTSYNGSFVVTAIGGSSGAWTFTVTAPSAPFTVGSATAFGTFSIDPTLTIQTPSAGAHGILLRSSTSQIANPFEYRDSVGNLKTYITGSGDFVAPAISAIWSVTSSAQDVTINAMRARTSVASGYRANLQTWENSTTVLAGINSPGKFFTGSTSGVTAAVGGTIQSIATGANPLVTMASAHGLATGDVVVLAGTTGSLYNGTFYVASVPLTTTFTITSALTTGQAAAGGTVSVAAQSSIVARSAGVVGQVIRGAASQVSDYLQIQNSGGTVLSRINSGGQFQTPTIASTDGLTAIAMAGNRSIQIGSATASIGGGAAVVGIANATTAPTSNPVGGGILYVDTGALKYLGTSGSAATIVNADGTIPVNYTLPKATASALGGVELFDATVQTTGANAVTTTAGRTYGAQLNALDQLVINVPWTDTLGYVGGYQTTASASTGVALTDINSLTSTGALSINTPSGSAASSNITISSGTSSTAATGSVTISTGITTASTFTTGALTLSTGASSSSGGNSGAITIRTGNGSGSGGNAGGLTIDSGAGSGGGIGGGITIGVTNSSSVTIGRTGASTTIAGTLTAVPTLPSTAQQLFLASPTTGSGTPAFRYISTSDFTQAGSPTIGQALVAAPVTGGWSWGGPYLGLTGGTLTGGLTLAAPTSTLSSMTLITGTQPTTASQAFGQISAGAESVGLGTTKTTGAGPGFGIIKAPQMVFSLADAPVGATSTTGVAAFAAANDTLSSLEAGKLYRFRGKYYVTYTAGGTAAALQMLFAFANAPQAIKYNFRTTKSTSTTAIELHGIGAVATGVTVSASNQTSGTLTVEFDGYFTSNATTGGTLIPQIAASGNTSGGTFYVTTGSWFEVQKVGTATQTLIAGNWS